MKQLLFVFVGLFILAGQSFAQKQTISQAEYFIGTDPGEGNGTALNIQSGDAQVSLSDSLVTSHPISYGGAVFVRVKNSGFTDINSKNVPGVWSLPTVVVFPTKAVLYGAQARIVHQDGSSFAQSISAASGTYDSVVQHLQVTIHKDSLQIGDTLEVRLQGADQLWNALPITAQTWSEWASIPIIQAYLSSVAEGASNNNENLSIFPNPASDAFTVSFTNAGGAPIHYEIDDVLGRILTSGETSESQLSLSASDLPAGVLLFRASSDGFVQTRRFVVTK